MEKDESTSIRIRFQQLMPRVFNIITRIVLRAIYSLHPISIKLYPTGIIIIFFCTCAFVLAGEISRGRESRMGKQEKLQHRCISVAGS